MGVRCRSEIVLVSYKLYKLLPSGPGGGRLLKIPLILLDTSDLPTTGKTPTGICEKTALFYLPGLRSIKEGFLGRVGETSSTSKELER